MEDKRLGKSSRTTLRNRRRRRQRREHSYSVAVPPTPLLLQSPISAPFRLRGAIGGLYSSSGVDMADSRARIHVFSASGSRTYIGRPLSQPGESAVCLWPFRSRLDLIQCRRMSGRAGCVCDKRSHKIKHGPQLSVRSRQYSCPSLRRLFGSGCKPASPCPTPSTYQRSYPARQP